MSEKLPEKKIVALLGDVTGVSIGGKRTAVAMGLGPVDNDTLDKLHKLRGKEIEIREARIEDTK